MFATSSTAASPDGNDNGCIHPVVAIPQVGVRPSPKAQHKDAEYCLNPVAAHAWLRCLLAQVGLQGHGSANALQRHLQNDSTVQSTRWQSLREKDAECVVKTIQHVVADMADEHWRPMHSSAREKSCDDHVRNGRQAQEVLVSLHERH